MMAFRKEKPWKRRSRFWLTAVFALFTVWCLALPAYAVERGDKGLEEFFKVRQHEPYVFGYEDDTFRPNRGITRGEAAQMLYSLLREPPEAAKSPFSDVPAGKWYSEAVASLAQLGVLHGYEDGTFRPSAPITRAELVAALTAFVPETGTKPAFSDVPESSWAYPSIVTAFSYGWIGGYPNGTFQPKKTISRAETVVVVNKALERTGAGFGENRTGKYFTDLTEDHWAYSHIVEASGAVARPPAPPEPGKKQLQVTASSLNLRSGPGTSYSVLLVVGKNTLLNLLENTNSTWIHVSTQDGVQGYVHKDYVEEYTAVTIPAKTIRLSTSSAELAQYQSFRLDGLSSPRTSLRWSSSNTKVAAVSTLRYGEGDESCFIYGKSPGTATVYCSDYGGNTLAKCSVTVRSPEPVRFAFTEPNLVTTKTEAKLVAITDNQKTGMLFTVEDSQGNCVLSQSVNAYLPEQYEQNETHVFQCAIGLLEAGEYHAKVCSQTGEGQEAGSLSFDFMVHGPEAPDVTTNTPRDVSDTMVSIMMEYESYLPVIRDDAAAPKNPTVGYGMVINANQAFYNHMTLREAKALLMQQISKNFGRYVNDFRKKYDLRMSQSQYDALVSFTYNLGPAYINDPAGNSLFTSILNAVVPPSGLSATNPCAAVLNVKSAGLYGAPAGNGTPKRQVSKGASFQVIGIQRNAQSKELWYQVKIGPDTGWMRGGNIKLNTPSPVHDLNYVDSMTFSNYILTYHHTDVCLSALLYRRLAEAKLFNHANYEQASSRHPLFTKNTYHYLYPDCMKSYE